MDENCEACAKLRELLSKEREERLRWRARFVKVVKKHYRMRAAIRDAIDEAEDAK